MCRPFVCSVTFSCSMRHVLYMRHKKEEKTSSKTHKNEIKVIVKVMCINRG